VVQVTLARLLATEIEELAGCPNRTGARGEIELDPVLVGVAPLFVGAASTRYARIERLSMDDSFWPMHDHLAGVSY
jgi:hypothetical protein